MPRQLLLTAGDAETVRQQLGLRNGETAQPLDVDELPLSPDLRQQIDEWAAAFVDQHRSRSADVEASRSWGERGIAVATALAGAVGPDVRLRYLAHSAAAPAAGPVAQPTAGLFEDVLMLPEIPIQVGWTAYQSTLTLEFDRGAAERVFPPEPWLTAERTDATDGELAEMRRRAIDPVVLSLLTPAELATLRVIVYQPSGSREVSLWLAAMGEEMRHWIHDPAFGGPMPDAPDVAERFADSMEDWVCETRFAWGQRRIAAYEVPPPR